jgi:uncharacterized protein (TIGR00159 family)
MENFANQWLSWKQWLASASWTHSWQWKALDFGLIVVLAYGILLIIQERRALLMVRGFITLILVAGITKVLELEYLSTVLGLLLLIMAVAMAVEFQSQLRRFLELLGQFRLGELFQPDELPALKSSDVVGEIIDAVKELSQNRTGAILVLETGRPIDERDFSVPGVRLNAELTKELLQTIFQTSTLLHDGAVLIRASRIVAAGVILPISEQQATPRRLGTRHRAAMGISERVKDCLCVVVSEETGSISLAEQGLLNRPLTSSKLKALLEERLSPTVADAVAPNLRSIGRQVQNQLLSLLSRLLHVFLPSTLREKK